MYFKKAFPLTRFPVAGIPGVPLFGRRGDSPPSLAEGVYFIASANPIGNPDPNITNWTDTTTQITDNLDGDETTWEGGFEYLAVLFAFTATKTMQSYSARVYSDAGDWVAYYWTGAAWGAWGNATITPGLGSEWSTVADNPADQSTKYVLFTLHDPGAKDGRIGDIVLTYT